MKLTRIHLESYKSLVNETLELSENCIGIVGINESGKSNILEAVRALEDKNLLNKKCSPKVNKSNPKIRFDFEPNKDQKEIVLDIIDHWLEQNSLIPDNLSDLKYSLEYLIEYDIEAEVENREFNLKILGEINSDLLFLKRSSISEGYKIYKNERFFPLDQAIVINTNDVDENNKGIENLKKEIRTFDKKIRTQTDKIRALNTKEGPSIIDKKDKELSDLNEELKKFEVEKENLEGILKEFNIDDKIKELEQEIEGLRNKIQEKQKKLRSYEVHINTLKVKPSLSNQQKSVRSRLENNLSSIVLEIKDYKSSLTIKNSELNDLKIPLGDKYSADKSELEYYLSKILTDFFEDQIPNVVFWKYSQEYILNSETKFEELKKISTNQEIPRPLMNVFRVGLDISNIDELKKAIKQIESDGNERSRLQDRLNKKLNDHISEIWPEYDQKVNISLEQHQIRIQFYDPKFENRSYFDMLEKSQGAQTFLSFLLTIGAEAATGVLSNTILLLDEPEIHLHPSGVRYMLRELIKISEKGNIVLYATHSIFMIDRSKYERHVYLNKNQERTSINPSKRDRIGFFMQEEVLYGAVNVNLYKDFRFEKQNNFVFEGDGDATIFEHLYSSVISKKLLPFSIDNCSFYQGGKCSTIINFLKQNPIQLGSKWIFIIDGDEPANKLRKFIESIYKDYINKDVFIFQYSLNDDSKDPVELEDLLPSCIVKECYLSTAADLNYEFEEEFIVHAMEKENYLSFDEAILGKYLTNKTDKLEFKSHFKTALNNQLRADLLGLTKMENFNDRYKIYSEWVLPVIEKLK